MNTNGRVPCQEVIPADAHPQHICQTAARFGSRVQRDGSRWLRQVGPSLIVALPLAGLALQATHQLDMYPYAAENANPVEAVRRTWRLVKADLGEGRFAPLDGYVDQLVYGLAIEAGESLNLAPHAAMGAVRLTLVAVVALLACKIVATLQRSAGTADNGSPLRMYPLVCAAAVVANGANSSLASTPHTSIGAVAVVLAAALFVSRDRDLTIRKLRLPEYVVLGLIGASVAALDELAYLTPFVAAAFLAARAIAAGVPVRITIRTAAARRQLALTAGFAAVYVPARIAVGQGCAASSSCADEWILSFHPDAIGTTVARLGGSLPLAGWIANGDRSVDAGLDLGVAAAAANSLLILAFAALIVLVFATALPRHGRQWESGSARASIAADRARSLQPRFLLVLALGGLGLAVSVAAALWAGLSWGIQQLPFGHAVRQGWRDTLLAQIGWSLIAVAVLVAADAVMRRHSERARRALIATTALVLVTACTSTLMANWQLAQVNRHDSTAATAVLISESAVNMGIAISPDGIAELNDWPIRAEDVGNSRHPLAVRCALLDGYASSDKAILATKTHAGASQLRANLNRLMIERYGVPYCSLRPRLGTNAS